MDNLWLKVTTPIVIAALAWFLKAHKERKTVGVAIYAEISALCDIARVRRYQEGLLSFAQALQQLPEEERKPQRLPVPIPDHYCRVYAGSVQHIGQLDADEAPLVVRFYQYIDSVVRDVTEGGVLHEGSADPAPFMAAYAMIGRAFEIEADLTTLRDQKRAAPFYKRLWRVIG